MPRTKLIASTTVRYAAATGPGIARTRASSLGSSASAISRPPAATPAARAATPVSSMAGTFTPMVCVGMMSATPDSSLPTPSAATAPCTAR